jgi:hypothetical protein
MPSNTRRRLLTTIGCFASISGCLEVGTDSDESDSAGSSGGGPESKPPAPSAKLPVLEGDTIEVDDSFRFDDAGVYGWRIDGSFTRAVDLAVSVEAGQEAAVYVTENQQSSAHAPESTVVSFETPNAVDGAELTSGTGTVLFETAEQTTLSVNFSATSI